MVEVNFVKLVWKSRSRNLEKLIIYHSEEIQIFILQELTWFHLVLRSSFAFSLDLRKVF